MHFSELDLGERLSLVRNGTAHFAQHLGELRDDQLDTGTLLPGWTRRHLLAHLGYNATALGRLLDWAATGIETPMYPSAEYRETEIAEGATLDGKALRKLFSGNAEQLDQKWRTLPRNAWTAQVRTAQGRPVPASETLWMRCREVWIHGVDLDSGAQFDDFPPVVVESLLTDIVTAWRRAGFGTDLVLEIEERAPIAVGKRSPHAVTVAGPLPGVIRWAVGRGAIGVRTSEGDTTPPPWM